MVVCFFLCNRDKTTNIHENTGNNNDKKDNQNIYNNTDNVFFFWRHFFCPVKQIRIPFCLIVERNGLAPRGYIFPAAALVFNRKGIAIAIQRVCLYIYQKDNIKDVLVMPSRYFITQCCFYM